MCGQPMSRHFKTITNNLDLIFLEFEVENNDFSKVNKSDIV